MIPVPNGHDVRENAYWGEVDVTPARQAAWQQWKDNYLATCIEGWVSQGESNPDDLAKAASVVLYDLAKVDDLPWMKLGDALTWRMAVVFGEQKELVNRQKTDYINSLRTAETSTEHERVLAVAYHLGVTVEQASNMRDRIRKEQAVHRDPEAAGRTALYRHYDHAGVLLYVGITKEPEKRADQHSRNSEWWRFMARTDVEWFDTRELAADAERSAIRDELPVFNTAHNIANRKAAVNYLYAALKALVA